MNILETELLLHTSFLQLTCDYPDARSSVSELHKQGLTFTLHDTGILQIEPEYSCGQDIIISSGIHGNETAPIEMCNQLVKDILSGTLLVKNRLLIIIGNPGAVNKGKRFETENLNRLFCGEYRGKQHLEALRAERLEHFTEKFFNEAGQGSRYHFDLHSAIRSSKYEKFAIYPYQDGRKLDISCFNLLKDSDINTVLLAHKRSSTYSYFSSHQCHATSFTIELGQINPFGENDMESFSDLFNTLKRLISNEYTISSRFDGSEFNVFRVIDEVIRGSGDQFSLNIDPEAANFTKLPLGFQLTTEDNGGYCIRADHQAVVFPNADVCKGQRVALIVEKTND